MFVHHIYQETVIPWLCHTTDCEHKKEKISKKKNAVNNFYTPPPKKKSRNSLLIKRRWLLVKMSRMWHVNEN